MIDLTNPIFQDAEKAREYLEQQRWPNGAVCPHCDATTVTRLKGRSTRPGVYKCKACEKPFSVTVKTVFERSKIPLNKWLLATFLLCASKKGISAHQLHRQLNVTYKTAWFMSHRIREAMRVGSLAPPMGGDGKIVEVDETYIGKKKGYEKFSKPHGMTQKMAVLTLVDREGETRSFHIDETTRRTILPIIQENIDRETKIATDQGVHYKRLKQHFADHGSVNHSHHEWRRGDIYTNTVEGYFSIFKRGMRGVYQHCSEQHLHRYLAEYDFRYNNRIKRGVDDTARTNNALKGIGGKRLMYRRPDPSAYNSSGGPSVSSVANTTREEGS